MKKVLPLALSGFLAIGGWYNSLVRADPPARVPVSDERIPVFPLEFGSYEYALRASVLCAGSVDGAVVTVDMHECDSPVFESYLGDHVSSVVARGDTVYRLSLSFRVNNSLVGKAARLILDDSFVDSVVRVSDSGVLVPVACMMSIGSGGKRSVSELLYDDVASEVRIRRKGVDSVVSVPPEYFSDLVTPPSLIVRIVNTPVHRDGERVLLGRFIDPASGRMENIESVISSVSSRDVSTDCIEGYHGSSLLMGSTIVPSCVFGGVSAKVGVFYTQNSGNNSFSAPMRGCLSFEIVNGGIIASLADITSSAYTSFVRFTSDER